MKLECINLCKSYEGVCVLDDLNICIQDVQSIAIIGPSGGGKSTLIRMIATLENVTSGKLLINDILVNDPNLDLSSYRKKIGFVFQNNSLFSHMTVLENIVIPLTKIHHQTKTEAVQTATTLLERFGLLDQIHKLPSKLSGGQQQRVAIVRAIALDTELLLFDEPTSALDPLLTEDVLTTISELKDLNKQFIIVTHAIEFARKFADYTIFIDQNKIIEHGKDILDNPQTDSLKKFLSKATKFYEIDTTNKKNTQE